MAAQIALVTGASAGIGLGLVKRLHAAGFNVIGCARNITPIEEIKADNIHAIKCDVSKEDEVVSMFQQINERFGGLDICVNNAGIASSDTLLEGSPDGWRKMFEVNVIGACLVSQHAVKSMKAKGGDNCLILNVNSLAGISKAKFQCPGLSFYSVTKHALNGATSALRGELCAQGLANSIRVMTKLIHGLGQAEAVVMGMEPHLTNEDLIAISPGLIQTGFVAKRAGEDYAAKLFQETEPLQIEDVVDCIMHALTAPKRMTVADQLIYPSIDFTV